MNWTLLVPLVVTSFVVILGWIVVHDLNSRRDQRKERRDKRVNYLIEAYRRLDNSSDRPGDRSRLPEIESAISDIQLFGTKRQVELAQEFSDEIGKGGGASAIALLEELRRDLREELKLEKLPKRIIRLRFD